MYHYNMYNYSIIVIYIYTRLYIILINISTIPHKALQHTNLMFVSFHSFISIINPTVKFVVKNQLLMALTTGILLVVWLYIYISLVFWGSIPRCSEPTRKRPRSEEAWPAAETWAQRVSKGGSNGCTRNPYDFTPRNYELLMDYWLNPLITQR